jgi:hypothetical protein
VACVEAYEFVHQMDDASLIDKIFGVRRLGKIAVHE